MVFDTLLFFLGNNISVRCVQVNSARVSRPTSLARAQFKPGLRQSYPISRSTIESMLLELLVFKSSNVSELNKWYYKYTHVRIRISVQLFLKHFSVLHKKLIDIVLLLKFFIDLLSSNFCIFVNCSFHFQYNLRRIVHKHNNTKLQQTNH